MAIKSFDYKKSNSEKKASTKQRFQPKSFGSSASGFIYINNITKSDVKSRNIRIIVENKHLFPAEKSGVPISYFLNFKIGNTDSVAKYKIGSKDGKSRSGILKLGDKIYQENLKIQIGTKLKISKSQGNKYIIKRF